MVVRVCGYYGVPFKGQHDMTQVHPLSPTIFNVVVNAVIWHWILVVVV